MDVTVWLRGRSVAISKRSVIRFGFGVVLALLLFALYMSYRVQRSYSNEALGIYHRRVEQEDLRYRLRRSLWMAAIAARDFLMNPNADREAGYARQLADLQRTSKQLLAELAALEHGPRHEEFEAKLHNFGDTLSRLPEVTAGFGPRERYEFIQAQIVPRRNAAADLLREFSRIDQQALMNNEKEFAVSRHAAASQLSGILAGCGLLGLLVAWLSLSHSESLERETVANNRALAQQREELSQLSTRLMAVQEEERGRISRELHDEVGQALATLRLELARAEPVCLAKAPEALDRLISAREIAERTLAAVRDMSALLRPSLLDDLGLAAAILWLADCFTGRTGVPCRIAVAEHHLSGLDEHASTCVFRVLQEALHNAEKYARATRVEIGSRSFDGVIEVTISDNGVGFSSAESAGRNASPRLGLLGMRERVAAIRGQLDVLSAPGKGTRITLRLPAGSVQVKADTLPVAAL